MGGYGRWTVAARLGAGGMGEVFLGQAADGDLAAVKVVRDEYADDPVFRARFRREVEACSRVRGPFVAELVDADVDGPRPWLAVQYVEGPTLAMHVAEQGALTPTNVRALAIGLADALAAIWSEGIVHRDLKPSNVILAEQGPVVIDFGIATATDATAITRTGVMLGSAGWIAPEVMLGRPCSARTDVWGWAGVVCFAASGTRPHGDGPVEALGWRALHADPDPDVMACVPSGLHATVTKALAAEPAERPDPVLLASLAAGQHQLQDAPATDARAERLTTFTRLWTPPVHQPPGRRLQPAARAPDTDELSTSATLLAEPDAPNPRAATSRRTTGAGDPASRPKHRSRSRRRRRWVAAGAVMAITLTTAAGALAYRELADDGQPDSELPQTRIDRNTEPSLDDPVAMFCEQFMAYDQQFTNDEDVSDQVVLDAIRSLQPPTEIAADHASLVSALEPVVAGTATAEDQAATETAGSRIQLYVDENCGVG